MVTQIIVENAGQAGNTVKDAVTETELEATKAQLRKKLPSFLRNVSSTRPATMTITLESVNKSINTSQAILVGDSMYINSNINIADNATGQTLASSPVDITGYGRAGFLGVVSSGVMGEASQFDTLTTKFTDKIMKTFYPSLR